MAILSQHSGNKTQIDARVRREIQVLDGARAASRLFSATALLSALALSSLFMGGCQVEEKGSKELEVTTLNQKYNRLHSHVLVRNVKTPTLANLDFAAYSKNVMTANPDWHAVHPAKKIDIKDIKFNGLVDDIKPTIEFTPLTEAEKARPMHWTPLLEHLLTWNFSKASDLANAYSSVTSEKWGDTSDVTTPYQEFASVYVHNGAGGAKEIWVEVEFEPWMDSFLEGFQDSDHDNFPEAFIKLSPNLMTKEIADEVTGEYMTKVLPEAAVMDWARNLASRWYPQYNTDLVEKQEGSWPYTDTPSQVKKEMEGVWIANPFALMRGHPYADTIYYVIQVDGMGMQKAAKSSSPLPGAPGAKKSLEKGLNERLDSITARLDGEVKQFGGSWAAWEKKTEPFKEGVKKFSDQEPDAIKGLIGDDKVLVFRRELEYLQAEDVTTYAGNKNPIPVIAAFKDSLAEKGIDFIFVPIPTKLDVYPEVLTPAAKDLPGHIAQPNLRKFMRDLAEARVETIDLLEPFLRLKAAGTAGKHDIYQHEDTHWSTLGLEAAAQIIASRVKQFSWYPELFHNRKYDVHDTTFEQLGDIQARLSDTKKATVAPEKLIGKKVVDEQGKLYEDSDSSAVLILGDSYTGVYQTVGCRNAGVTAHIAKNLGGPVDLIMGWGGGPEAPHKLKKRGADYLQGKRLVIWMMSVRDLFVYPGDWTVD